MPDNSRKLPPQKRKFLRNVAALHGEKLSMTRLLLISLVLFSYLFVELSLGREDASHSRTDQSLAELSDWRSVQTIAESSSMPIVLLIEQSDCGFCKRVKTEFLRPLAGSKRYKGRVLFRTLNIDDGLWFKDQTGNSIKNRSFCQRFDACFTPTVLFLDSSQTELAKRIIGFSGPDYYGYYLEKLIDQSLNIQQEKRSVSATKVAL